MPEQHINLQLGWPTPSLFPAVNLLEGASDVLGSQKKTAAALVYGPDAGYAPLRASIADWLSSYYSRDGAPGSTAERICITNGASGNLDNILARFSEPGYTRRIWMIEPSYFLACPIFTDNGYQGRLRGVPEDEEGLDIDFLRAAIEQVEAEEGALHAEPRIKTLSSRYRLYKHIIYAVPTFANPSGKTMSLRRRRDLVRLAREFDALVVTDDVYDVLRWPAVQGQSQAGVDAQAVPPRIVDIDRVLDGGPRDEWGNAASNGSFSKIIAPGVRTGWCEATPAFATRLSNVGASVSGGCPAHLVPTFIDNMISSGKLEAHIKDLLIPTYSSRYYALHNAVQKHLVPLGFKVSTGTPYDPDADTHDAGAEAKTNGHGHSNGHTERVGVAGGYFTYLSVPTDLPVSAAKLAAFGMDKYNLKFAFGAMMTVEGDEGSVKRAETGYGNAIRLSWAWHPEAEIEEGIERLAALVMEVKKL
jgi:DNA-binding transcriptional MocR family regulator